MYKESNLERIKILTNEVETLKEEKDVVDGKLARLLKSLKYLENIIESQRPEKVKKGVGYNAVPLPAADLYLSPKKDLSWTGLPEFVDDTVTDYSRPLPTVASTSAENQNKDTFTSEDVASTNPPKPFVKFVKPKDSQPESKLKEHETPKKSQVKYPEQNRHSNKRPKGNQKNWNNLKSNQLGPEFVLHKKPCFNCGNFSHLANDCWRRVQRETNRSQNHSYKSSTHRFASHRPNGTHMRPPLRSSGSRPHGDSMRPSFRPAGHRPHGPLMNPIRPTMNRARPYKTFFQTPSYETRPFLKSSAVKISFRAPWVPTVNRYVPPVNRKFSTSRRNFPTANRKFPTASRKFTTGSTENHTADMGRKGKAVKPSAFKRIFRDLKGHPKLGLWYPKASSFDLVAYSDSDYGGASQDRKSTTGGSQFLGRRLILWQCKKKTILATSTTKAEYVTAASCYGQVLWIQNQLLDYGVDHIHTDENVADLLTKPFDAGRFQYLVGEGSDTQTKPHHTPFPEVESSHPTTSSMTLPSIPTALIPTVTQSETTPIIQYSRRARIAQSSALPTITDEPASPARDDSQGEACPTDSGFIADQDRATIAKSSTLPRDSAPSVTPPKMRVAAEYCTGALLHNITATNT
uniref:CCHC-type domain-containing protein n=1 Tax=Tanacetum cinerariifolium TaxID=118510 RepID=A0A6L2JVJ7_TANCI|nr:hypothetical protein [Tanacetum cinerariifolium]